MDTCGYGITCPAPPPPPGHLLPYTGLDVYFLVFIGVTIILAGIVLAKASRRG